MQLLVPLDAKYRIPPLLGNKDATLPLLAVHVWLETVHSFDLPFILPFASVPRSDNAPFQRHVANSCVEQSSEAAYRTNGWDDLRRYRRGNTIVYRRRMRS